RHLSQNEITRLTAVLRDHPQRTSADAILIMMLTGARRSEVLKATWDQFDLDTGIWIKPSAHTKQRRLHRVPISAAAVDLLRRRQVDSEGAFVFPGSDPSKPLTEVKRIWATVCREAGLSEWAPVQTRDGHIKQDEAGADIYAWRSTVRLHDLRHTYASILASQGLSLPIIGALLGHTQPQTTARYAHLLDDPLREATERAARAISSNGQGVNRTFDRAEPGSKA
ncbi:MAG: site-specific integrase, partial [Pseudomonadota bacterium]